MSAPEHTSRKKPPNLNGLFDELKGALHRDSSGNISFEAFSHDGVVTTLSTFLEFHKDVPDPMRTGLINQAIDEAAKSGNLSEVRFSNQLKKLEQEYLRRDSSDFHFYTSLSFIRPNNLNKVVIKGTTFNFKTGDYPKFSRKGLTLHGDLRSELRTASLYTRVHFKIQARCPQSAAETAFDKLDFFRGLWNLTHIVKEWRISSGMNRPVNAITLGPIHTIHTPDGKRATEVYWYEPFFSKDQKTLPITNDYEAIRSYEKRLLRSLAKKSQPLQDQLVQGVIRYCRALDQIDYEAAFLKLWGVLEFLTNTVGGSYDQTIRRTAFIFETHQAAKIDLEHLRRMRNRSVHSGEASAQEKSERILYQLKGYVRRLLHFQFTTPISFRDLHEIGLFLDTTTDRESLQENIKRNQEAWKFQRFDQSNLEIDSGIEKSP